VTSGCAKKSPEPAKAVKEVKPATPVSDVEEIGWMRLDPGPRPADSLQAYVPVELPERVRSFYRIKPDRRMLYALVEVERLVSDRRAVSTLTIRFEDGRWRLALEKTAIGSLPETPSFADFRRLLSDWTASTLKRHAITPSSDPVPEVDALEQDLTQGSSDKVLTALRALNPLAEQHPFHPRLLAAAARGTAWLLLQTHDELDLSDPLAGHALALVALAQALQPGSVAGDEAILDRALGYETAAAEAARALSAEDPIRWYAEFDAAALRKATARLDAPPRTQYLNLLEMARRGNQEDWFDAMRRSWWSGDPKIGLMHASLLLRDFETDRSAPAVLARATLAAAADAASGKDRPAREIRRGRRSSSRRPWTDPPPPATGRFSTSNPCGASIGRTSTRPFTPLPGSSSTSSARRTPRGASANRSWIRLPGLRPS
jgi:hypothetical protein